jgi:hypothetical protein
VGRGKRVWVTRGIVLASVVAAGGAIGVVVLTGATGPAKHGAPKADPTAPVPQFASAWHDRDYRRMYDLISPRARARVPYPRFVAFYRQAAKVATMRGLHQVGKTQLQGDIVSLVMSVATRTFGRVPERMSVPVVHTRHGQRVSWTRALCFPGLRPGERLVRHIAVPQARGKILDFTGNVLAEGPATERTYPQGPAFALVTGYVKAPAPADVAERERAGWPATQPYGQGGLERSLDPILAGSPRFVLRAVSTGGV